MVDVSRTFTVAKSPTEVLDYLRDFSRAEEWDPGTVSCARADDGPVRVGSTWRNVSKFLGKETELTYELTKAGPDHLQFVGRNKTATSTDDIAIVPGPTAGTTEITYRAHIDFSGVAKLASPVAKLAMERLGTRTEERLRRILGPVGVG